MEAFRVSFLAVSPLILTVVFGYWLKRSGLISPDMVKGMNRLVFRGFLPITLFLNMYKIDSAEGLSFGALFYAILMILAGLAVSFPLVFWITKKKEHRGVLLQCCFRSNCALIGIALSESLYGEAGASAATLLVGFIVPMYNVLAVVILSVFRSGGEKLSVKKLLGDVARNPLILGVAAGGVALLIRALLNFAGISFRLTDLVPVYQAAKSISSLSTPLALIVLGAQFEFSAVSALKKEILFGTVMRTVFFPALGLGTALIAFRDVFSPAYFAAFVAVFASPVAVSSVPMTQAMDGDAALAGQLVVWTTAVSSVTVFLFCFLLSSLGIF